MVENIVKTRDCYGMKCKICTTCYPNRKPVIAKKLNMKILGIGNAIVNVWKLMKVLLI